MSVNWGKSLIITPKEEVKLSPSTDLWTTVCYPTKISHIHGNKIPRENLDIWLKTRIKNLNGSSCLIIKGHSGVGKSCAADLYAKEAGFGVLHTYADTPRTPQKLQYSLRQITMCNNKPPLLILDDFESFISETTSMKDILKFARSTSSTKNDPLENLTIIVICNEIDKSFKSLFNISTVIEFDKLNQSEMNSALNRLSTRVSPSVYIPPMDIFLLSSKSNGNIRQTINEMQLYYIKSKKPRNKRQKTLKKVCSVKGNDMAFRDWGHMHRSSSIECFLAQDGWSILDCLASMSKGFHMAVRDNLHSDYPYYFHSKSIQSMDCMSKVSDSISGFDTYCLDELDALYDTENSQLWAGDNVFGLANMTLALYHMNGKKRGDHKIKKKRGHKKMSYIG